MAMEDDVIGIDLGTTYSVVASINPDGRPQAIPDSEGRTTTPSVVYLGGNTPIVGYEAKEYQNTGASEVASFFKRDMGDPHYAFAARGRTYSPIDLSALVLGHLKAQAEGALGRSIRRAVITTPAYFTHTQREATIAAGRLAGLDVLAIISEPTAAALAYGVKPSANAQKLLVYDLGGGTFDISLVAISTAELTVIATDGDDRLGGKDWDDRLLHLLNERFRDEHGVDLLAGSEFNELLTQAEQAKRSLSSLQSVQVRVNGQGAMSVITVTRAEFEALARDLLERTGTLVNNVLREAGLDWDAIDGVVPVGGSTKMPMVREYLQRLSGKTPMSGINPDEAVGLGAAVYAAMELERVAPGTNRMPLLAGRKKIQDVIAHSLGMIAESQDRARYLNSILIARNLQIPSNQTRPYAMRLKRSGDSTLEVFLTQGEDDNPQACAYLGRYVFSQFPMLSTRDVIIDITYAYDQNGVVHVTARERSTQTPLKLTVEALPTDVPARFLGRPIDQQDGQREHITIYMSFDVSGSMSGAPLAAAQKAALAFLEECDLSMTSIGIISCSDTTHVDLAASQNAHAIQAAIRGLRCGSTGGGNSGDPFEEIHRLLNNGQGLGFAIVLADGVWGRQSLAIQRAQRCHRDNIQVVAIGFGGADEAFLRAIASTDAGSIFTSMQGLTEAFSTIAREITESGGMGGHLRGA